jgi:zinc transporter, ZIP family
MELFALALGLGTIGLVAGAVGAVVAAIATRGPTSTLTSYVQHFAAGLIIAAATLDLLPEALHLGGGWPLIAGFVLGTAFMLGLRALLNRVGHSHAYGHEHGHGHAGAATAVNLRLVVALAVVVLIDGAIIGVALSAGGAAALLIAIALSIELLFVAASTAGSTRAAGGAIVTAIAVGAVVAVMMPVGAVLGALVFAGVSTPVLIAGLAFGAAALLFTAVAELLVEAYEIKESTGTIAMAAAGFLLFLVLMMLM